MVVPIELDEAARAAIDAAQLAARDPETGSEGTARVLVAPRLEDRYASYGVIATVDKVGRLSGGGPAAVLKAGGRASIGTGVSGPGAALWVEAEPVADGEATDEVHELAEEYRHLVIALLQRREAWQVVDTVSRIDDPATLADMAGYAPYLSNDRKRELLETPDVGERLRLLIAWTRDHAAESEVNDKIAEDVRESLETNQREFLLRQQLAAIRKELGEDDAGGVDDYRARVEAADGARQRPRGAAARGRQAGADQRAEPRDRLDPHLAGHRARPALVGAYRGQQRRGRRPRDPGRRPPRAGRGEGPDHRVPRGACASGRSRPRRRRRSRVRRGDPAGRPSGRGQDLARRVGGPHPRPEVRPGRARRRTRRGGDPRAPAHVRRRAAWPDRPGDQGGRLDEPGRAARRGRQGRRRLPRRSVVGPARGARPGAEPHVPRPLPRAGPRPVRRPVHRHGQRGRADPAGPAGPDGAGDDRRLHRGRQDRDRSRLPGAPAAGAGRAHSRRGDDLRRGAARDRRQPHPRGRGPPGRAAAREGVPQGRDPARRPDCRPHRHRRGGTPRAGRPAAVHAGHPRAHVGVQVSRPAWP